MTNFRYTVIAHNQSDGSAFVYDQTRSESGARVKVADAERSGFGPAHFTDSHALVDSGAGRREPGEDFAYAVEDDSEWI